VIRVALDAMGGDHAPVNEIRGAIKALAALPDDVTIVLVGQTAIIEAELARQVTERRRIEIVEAPEVVGMGDKPVEAIRGKRKSSIAIGLGLVKAGQADSFISAGNTGAVMAGATLLLKLYPGFARPAIGTPFPTIDDSVLVLDGGANVDCTAEELVGFARLGVHYARDVLGRANPAIGLLNIGEEEEKGNAAAKEAFKLLKESGLPFIGNVEGRDLIVGHTDKGHFDVVVCDGFVGNIILKFYESVAMLFHQLVEREVGKQVAGGADFRKIWDYLDYARFGGAPLLGVRGVCIICHGKSSDDAIASAVRVAVEASRHKLVQHMNSQFAAAEKK
jgi:glycerol-3-phosphate acyltransferase PlsX